MVGDKHCDGGIYNTPQCNEDGLDCAEFNAKYPNCTAPIPTMIDDLNCDLDAGPEYNTEECGWDGGDCLVYNRLGEDYINCKVPNDMKIKDGECDGPEYNNEDCQYDGGDCAGFDADYPLCEVDNPTLIANGNCDGGKYNVSSSRF